MNDIPLLFSMNIFPQDNSYALAFGKMAGFLQEIVAVVIDADANFTKLSEYRAQSVKLEETADKLTHEMFQKLNSSFITPYDRDDIFDLIEGTDEIIDRIDHFINDIDIYGITENRHYLGAFAPLYVQGAVDTKKALKRLFEKNHAVESVLKSVIALRAVGSHGEVAYENNLRDLFATCNDPILIIKWKAVIEAMRNVTRAYKALANIIEDILMKNG